MPEKTSPKIEKPKEKDLKVSARFIRTAPDKIRFAGRQILNKKLDQALAITSLSTLQAAKNLESILKNAQNLAKEKDLGQDIYVRAVIVNDGPKLKRRRIIHRGRSTAILKRLSHVTIYLAPSRLEEAQRAERQPKINKSKSEMRSERGSQSKSK